MELDAAKRLGNELLKQHGLDSQGWTILFYNRKRTFGTCAYLEQIIYLSAPLVLLNSENEVRHTILHEIAHALIPAEHGHDSVWKAKCAEIGGVPERCYNEGSRSVNVVPKPYIAYCPIHGEMGRYYRKRKLYCKRCYYANWRVENVKTLLTYSHLTPVV